MPRSHIALNNSKRRGRLIVFLCLLFLAGCSDTDRQDRVTAITIAVTGDAYNWHFQYPGRDGILGTKDDHYTIQNLFLPDNADVTLKLSSNDYLYTFALPEFGLKEIAVPDLQFDMAFTTNATRTLQLLGDQFCGFSHDSLKGEVHILDQTVPFYDQIRPENTVNQTQTEPLGRPDRL